MLARRSTYSVAVLAIAALALWLRAPAFNGALLADDWDHYAMVAGIYPTPRNALDRFDFVANADGDRSALMRAGRLPWWSAPELQLSVLRPLSSLLVDLDYTWLDAGHAPLRAHVHSALWWLALLVAVAGLLRALLPAPVALSALALFALDEAQGLPFAWIANRNALVAISFATFGLWAHVVYRRGGSGKSRWLSLALVALGLLGGEHAFAVLAYFFAFELVGMRGPSRERVRAVLPVAALGVAYLVVRGAFHYGVAGSGFYIDPAATPVRFIQALGTRVPLLLGDLFFGFRAEWYAIGPPFRLPGDARALQLGVGYLALTTALLALLGFRQRARDGLARDAQWLLLGAVAAVVPVSSTMPMARLTLAAAIGADALLALVLLGALRRVRAGSFLPRAGAALIAAAIVYVHGFLAASHSRAEVGYIDVFSNVDDLVVRTASLDERALPRQDVFIVAAREQTTSWALPYVRHAHGLAQPKTATLLSAEQGLPHELRRVAANAFELHIVGPPHPHSFVGSVYRSRELSFEIGLHIASPHFEVEVLELTDGQPSRLRFRFERALDDAGYLFVHGFPDGLRAFPMPALGQSVLLPSPTLPVVTPAP